MAQNTQTFILVGDFKDNITPKLRKLNRELTKFSKDLNKSLKDSTKGIDKNFEKMSRNAEKSFKGIGKGFDKAITDAGRGIGKLEGSLNDAGRAAGKVRDTVSQIGEGLKGFDDLAGSMEGVARAAGRAQDEVLGIGEAAGRANKQADSLMDTLLKAEGLSKFGDAMAQGFSRGMNSISGMAVKGARFAAAQYKAAMEDEMADIKAQTSVQGSFTQAGFKGGAEGGGLTFGEAGKFYKKFDMEIAELIRTSSAPTSKVVELQRLTMDTLGPLLLAAEGVPKGTDVRKIDQKTIESTSKTYGGMLEQIALLSQGTGTATFRVAQGVEGLIKRGKIDTTMDFFTDNVLLMQALQEAGFAGGMGGSGTKVSSLKTEAERLEALQKALSVAQSKEGIEAMSTSMLGSIQALGDTLTNPQVGLFGMAATFTGEEQQKVNKQVKNLFNTRIASLKKELQSEKTSEARKRQLIKDIERVEKRRDELTKEGDEKVTTPFKAFSLIFGGVIRNLTEVLNTIGPIWNRFAAVGLEWTFKFLEPLEESLRNISSDLRGGQKLSIGVGRLMGEFYKFIGTALGDLGKALSSPDGAMGKVQSEFLQGFMSAFKDPAEFEKVKKGFSDGLTALVTKLFSILGSILTSEEMRPIVLPWLAMMFAPPVMSAIISGITPLLITSAGKFFIGLFAKAKAIAVANAALGAAGTGGAAATAAGGSAAAAAGGGAGAIGGLSAVPVWGWIAALAAAVIVFEKPIMAFTNMLKGFGEKLTQSENWLTSAFGHFIKGVAQLAQGITKFFNGLWEIVSGLLTGDVDRVIGGIKKLFTGLWDTFVGIGRSVGGMGGMITGAIGNIFRAVAGVIDRAARKLLGLPMPTPDTSPKRTPAEYNARYAKYKAADNAWLANKNKNKGPRPQLATFMAEAKGSDHPFMGSLGEALNHEMKNKPKGSDLVIANSSETIIPAADGLGSMKVVVDAIWRSGAQVAATTMKGFDELRTTIAAGDAKNAQVTTRAGAMTKSAIDRSVAVSMAGDAKIMSAIKAVAASGGFNADMGGPLGGVTGNLQAAASLAKSMGLTMTSYKRNGPPSASYHNVGRAMDFSNSTGPTPQMMQFAQAMAARYGSSIAELIYTPLGYSIKNGKKVAPYAQAGHYNHVHVAFARGLDNPRLFTSAKAAAAYEGMMAPAGAKVSTITANSSENLGGHTTVNQNITINGAEDPRRLAEMVFNYAAQAAQNITNSSFA